MNLETRAFQSGDERGIVALLENVFNGWPNGHVGVDSLDHWIWKYRSDGHEGDVVVTLDGDRIIGCHHGTCFVLRMGTRLFRSTYGSDMAVHVDYRGNRISRVQTDLLYSLRSQRGVESVLSLASNPRNIASLEKRWPRFPFHLENLVLIFDIDLHLKMIPMERSLLMKYGFLGVSMLNNLINRRKLVHLVYSFESLVHFDERFDAFLDSVNSGYDFMVGLSSEYLNWRYCDERAGEYLVHAVFSGTDLKGFYVLGFNRTIPGYPIGYVMDFLCLDDADLENALMNDLLDTVRKMNINIVNFLGVKNGRYEKLFNGFGFVNSLIDFHLFYKYFEEKDPFAVLSGVSSDRVYFSWGVHDTLPSGLPTYQE